MELMDLQILITLVVSEHAFIHMLHTRIQVQIHTSKTRISPKSLINTN